MSTPTSIFPNIIPFVPVRVISKTTIPSDSPRGHGEGAERTRALKCSHVIVTFASQSPTGMNNRRIQFKNVLRTFWGYFIKIKFKSKRCFPSWNCLFAVLLFSVASVRGNRPPRFLIDGQTEIVLRLKEGVDTPVGKICI